MSKCKCGKEITINDFHGWSGCNELGEDYYQWEYSCNDCIYEDEGSGWGEWDPEDESVIESTLEDFQEKI